MWPINNLTRYAVLLCFIASVFVGLEPSTVNVTVQSESSNSLMALLIAFTFSRCFCPKQLTVIHTFMHWWQWLPCKVPTSTSGAVWGSVSSPRTLWHAHRGNRTSDLPITRHWLYPWATAAEDWQSCDNYSLLSLAFGCPLWNRWTLICHQQSSVADITGHWQHAGDFTCVTFNPGIISMILTIYVMQVEKQGGSLLHYPNTHSALG